MSYTESAMFSIVFTLQYSGRHSLSTTVQHGDHIRNTVVNAFQRKSWDVGAVSVSPFFLHVGRHDKLNCSK